MKRVCLAFAQAHVHACADVHRRTCAHTHTCTDTHTHTHTCTHALTNAHTCTHMHSHMHIRTHTHAHTPSPSSPSLPSTRTLDLCEREPDRLAGWILCPERSICCPHLLHPVRILYRALPAAHAPMALLEAPPQAPHAAPGHHAACRQPGVVLLGIQGALAGPRCANSRHCRVLHGPLARTPEAPAVSLAQQQPVLPTLIKDSHVVCGDAAWAHCPVVLCSQAHCACRGASHTRRIHIVAQATQQPVDNNNNISSSSSSSSSSSKRRWRRDTGASV